MNHHVIRQHYYITKFHALMTMISLCPMYRSYVCIAAGKEQLEHINIRFLSVYSINLR